jgi:hypothetical protein
MARFETEVGLPCRNPRYTPDGKHGEEFPPVNAKYEFWQQAISMSWNYLAECGDIKNGWILSQLIWVEQPKQYSLDDPLTVVTATGIRFISHDTKKEDEQIVFTEPINDDTTSSGFTGFTGNDETVLFNQQPISLSAGGIQIPDTSTVFKNPA